MIKDSSLMMARSFPSHPISLRFSRDGLIAVNSRGRLAGFDAGGAFVKPTCFSRLGLC